MVLFKTRVNCFGHSFWTSWQITWTFVTMQILKLPEDVHAASPQTVLWGVRVGDSGHPGPLPAARFTRNKYVSTPNPSVGQKSYPNSPHLYWNQEVLFLHLRTSLVPDTQGDERETAALAVLICSTTYWWYMSANTAEETREIAVGYMVLLPEKPVSVNFSVSPEPV